MLSACRFATSKLLVALNAFLLLIVLTKTGLRSKPPSRRLAKATINYPSLPNLYKEALALHSEQNARFGYAQHELHVPIMKGGANLFYFLVSTITSKLIKPIESRVEWILCAVLEPS